MPAPFQRTDDERRLQHAKDHAEEQERKRQCEELRQATLAKAHREQSMRNRKKAESQARWERAQAEHLKLIRQERLSQTSARREASGLIEEARLQRDLEIQQQREAAKDAATKALGEFMEQQSKFEQEAREADRKKNRRRISYENRIRVAKLHEARDAANEWEQRTLETSRVQGMRAEQRARERRRREDEARGNCAIRMDMAAKAKAQAEAKDAYNRARAQAADEKKEDLLEYLRTDHRVPRWEALGWHRKDGDEWRWPFALDWSWLERGERVLRNERFVGLDPRHLTGIPPPWSDAPRPETPNERAERINRELATAAYERKQHQRVEEQEERPETVQYL